MNKREKPKKPYETFPLFAHRKGYWAKTIGGRHVPFGKWEWPDQEAYERSWKEAFARFKQYQEDLAHGRLVAAKPERMTIETLVDAYLAYQHARARSAKSKEIGSGYFAEIRRDVTGFRDFVGRARTIAELEAFEPLHPDDSPVMRFINAMAERYGWHRYNKVMTLMSGMWSWAEHPVRGVLGRPFRLKALFEKREELLKRREKRQREEERGKQRWTPDEIQAFFTHAPMPLRAMLKLMYFAAFGNSDCADVPQAAFNLAPGPELGLPAGWAIEYFVRPKTEIERAAVLPAECVENLKAAIASRPDAADKAWDNRVFLTLFGNPWVRDAVHEDPAAPGLIHHVTNIDSIAGEFRKLRNRLAKCSVHGWFAGGRELGQGYRADRKGKEERAARRPAAPTNCPVCGVALKPMRRLGAYTFRHTAITYASGAADLDALHLFEGHAIPGVRREYIEEVEVHRLRQIADRLAAKLHGAAPAAGTIATVIQNASTSLAVLAAGSPAPEISAGDVPSTSSIDPAAAAAAVATTTKPKPKRRKKNVPGSIEPAPAPDGGVAA